MRHALYENPATGKFALIRLPAKYVDGQTVPIPPTARWFDTREEALATIADLFNVDDSHEDDSVH